VASCPEDNLVALTMKIVHFFLDACLPASEKTKLAGDSTESSNPCYTIILLL